MPTPEPLGPLYSQTSPAGLNRLMAHLLLRFPGSRSGGMYNPVSKLTSGAPSPHRVTSALDLMIPGDLAPHVIRYMVQPAVANPLNLQQVISWHEIWTVQRQGEGIRRYPADDHSYGNGHAHIQVGLYASRNFIPQWLGGAGSQPTPAPPPAPAPPPPPPPPLPTEEDDSPVMYYPVDKHMHSFWIDPKGDLQHHWGPPTPTNPHGLGENLSAVVRKKGVSLGPLDPNQPVRAMVQPDTMGSVIQVDTFASNGWIIPFRFEGNPIGWNCIPYPPF